MPSWTTACPDWERRILAGQSLLPCGPLFPDEAAAAMAVFKSLRVVDVGGAPTVGEIARPWIIDFASVFFGALDPESGQRMIQTYFLKVPKKNWKSGITAFLMGTLLIRNWRESGEFGIIAPTTEVANNAFGPLKHAIRKDEELSDLLHIQDHIRTITHRSTKATLQVVAAESDTVSGKKFAVTLVEELWQFGKRNNAEAMLQEATGGMASRPEGATIYITTESDEPPAGVYKAKNNYARKVRDGEIVDPSFLPVLYEWPKAMVDSKACLDLENAAVVNPNLGASVSTSWLKTKYAEYKSESDRAFQAFCAKHLNVEIGLALGSDRWAGADFWLDAKQPGLTFEGILQRCEVAVVGIDGGGLDDLLGLAVVGREKDTGAWLHWAHAWAHEIVLERRKDIAALLKDLEAAGDLTIVKVPGKDVEDVADIVCQIQEAGLLPEKMGIGVDAAGIVDIVEMLTTQRKLPLEMIVAIRQGYSLNGAIKTTERHVAGKNLLHCGQALMSWCVGNARIEDKGNAILVTKQASGKAKIDPLMATFNAVSLMALNPASSEREYQIMVFG